MTDQIRADGRGEGLLEVTPYAGWEQGFTRDLWIPFRLSERSNDYVAFDLRNEPETVMNGLIALVESTERSAIDLKRQAGELGLHTVRINSQPMLFRRATLEPEVRGKTSSIWSR